VVRDRAVFAEALRDGPAAREWPMREILNGIFYVVRAGCPRRLLPKDLPPWGRRFTAGLPPGAMTGALNG
jgi:transposase